MQNISKSGADVVQLKEAVANLPTGNALPILAEIHEALGRLVESGTTAVIDLGSIPFTGGDEKRLQEVLGEGEVNAVLNAMGESFVQETEIPGVWRVDHYDQQGETQSRFIEVTFIPDILRTHREDAVRGHEMLAERLNGKTGADKKGG
ncbi:hydrogenase expression/formation C-terminal domain-containing protein [Aliiruegeria sabulilitoris]|uniref:hydrogenase expression/formation C-terminal domain-containing protein n=1 Tax=Aliiruegeria sabulilitoris TaxID=1510458 RepID=UPI000834DD37|nr:hydrogenase expression/formation C-terminal domain-containing protein [Aliiruegeria sabulilitoris]